MKKKIISILMTTAMVMTLAAGCGSSSGSSAGSEDKKSAEGQMVRLKVH